MVLVVVGEGEAETEVVGVAARTTGVLEVCVLEDDVLVCFRVEDWAGGRLSVYWSATGRLADEVAVDAVVVEVDGVVVVLLVVAVGLAVVGVVDVEVVAGVSALAVVGARTNPIVATRTLTTSSRWRDR